MPEMEVNNNYLDVSKKHQNEELHYDNESKLQIKLPFRMLLIGATGSGKTNVAIDLIKKINAWDKILLFAKNTEEPLYAELIECMRKAEKETRTEILIVSDNIATLPRIETINKKSRTLLIVDDMMSEGKRKLKPVEDYWTRGRKKNVSMMWLSQLFFRGAPQELRANSDYIIISKIMMQDDLHRIIKQYQLGVSNDEMDRLYMEATKGGFPHFFLLDLHAGTEEGGPSHLRYRRDFTPLKFTSIQEEKAAGKKGAKKGEAPTVEESAAPPKAKAAVAAGKEEQEAAKQTGKVGKKRGRTPSKAAPKPEAGSSSSSSSGPPKRGKKGRVGFTKGGPNTSKLNGFIPDKYNKWFRALPAVHQKQVAEYKAALSSGDEERIAKAVHHMDLDLVDDAKDMLHDDVEMLDSREPGDDGSGDEEMHDRNAMDTGAGLQHKAKRRKRGKPARLLTETEKALERLWGTRLGSYWRALPHSSSAIRPSHRLLLRAI